MTTNPWDLMRELATIQDRMNRVWGNAFDRPTEDVTSRGWMPPADIYQSEANEFILKAELPGLRREDIDLTVEHTTLTIRGERRRDDSVPTDRYHRIERQYGPFSRSFTLPNTLDASRIRADYRDGVLTVTLPLRQEARPRQIEVEVQQ